MIYFFQKLQADLLENMEKQLQDLVDEFVHEIEKIEQAPINGIGQSSKWVHFLI